MKRYHTRKQASVEEEFEEPFWEVVRGLTIQGHTRYDIARILGWSPGAFHRLIIRQAPKDIKWQMQKGSVANCQRWNLDW